MTEEERSRIVDGMVERETSNARKPEIVAHTTVGHTTGRARVTSEPVKDERGMTANDYLVPRDVGVKVGGEESVVDAVRRDRKESGAKSPNIPANIPKSELGQPFSMIRHSKEFTEEEDVVIVNGLLAQLPLYIIAEKLHCARHILSNHIKESNLLQSVWNDREESLLDHVEFQAKRLVDSGNAAMIMYWLDRKGKSRGWSQEKTQEVVEDDSRIVIGEIPDSAVVEAEKEIAQITADAVGTLSAHEVAERLSEKGEVPDPMKMAVQESEIQRMQDEEDNAEYSSSQMGDVVSDMEEFGGGFDDGGGFWG